MAEAGAKLIADTTAIGSVGLWESVPFIIPTLQIQNKAKKYLQTHLPDAIILIDYVGPNLAIASSLKKKISKYSYNLVYWPTILGLDTIRARC